MVKKDEQDIKLDNWDDYNNIKNNGTEEEKKMMLEKVKNMLDRMYQSRTEKQDKLLIIKVFPGYGRAYIEHLQKRPINEPLCDFYRNCNVLEESKNGEPSPFEQLAELCEIPDDIMKNYDELPASCKQIIIDFVYGRMDRDGYRIECTFSDFIKLGRFLIRGGNLDIYLLFPGKIIFTDI